MKKALLAMIVAACLGSVAQAAVTITSTAPGSGVEATTTTPPGLPIATWVFTLPTNDPSSLTTLDHISLKLTLEDGDSDSGEFDYGDLTLALDEYDTGLKLNGFPNNQTKTQTLTTSAPDNAALILAALKHDGVLIGTLLDADSGGNWIGVGSNNTILSLTGEGTTDGAAPVPAPGAVFLGAIGTSIVGWFRRRRSI
jgi:hypothetical protein